MISPTVVRCNFAFTFIFLDSKWIKNRTLTLFTMCRYKKKKGSIQCLKLKALVGVSLPTIICHKKVVALDKEEIRSSLHKQFYLFSRHWV